MRNCGRHRSALHFSSRAFGEKVTPIADVRSSADQFSLLPTADTDRKNAETAFQHYSYVTDQRQICIISLSGCWSVR